MCVCLHVYNRHITQSNIYIYIYSTFHTNICSALHNKKALCIFIFSFLFVCVGLRLLDKKKYKLIKHLYILCPLCFVFFV